MRSQLFIVFICLGAVIAAAQEQAEQKQVASANNKGLNDAQIRRILEDNTKTLDSLDKKAHSISNSQKGIEGKLKKIGQELEGINNVEKELKKLDKTAKDNFKSTEKGIKDLTNIIKAAENKTDRAVLGLSKTQQEIKQVLIQVDANQNKYERNLDEVAKSVVTNIAGLDTLIKQGVLKELVSLGQSAKKLEYSQKNIEGKIAYLDELAALSTITASKVNLLEQGIRSLNSSQQLQLAGISQTIHQVGTTSWQIDNKLGVLLSTQKNIERAMEDCKKCQHHAPKPHHYNAPAAEPHVHYDSPKQPQRHYGSAKQPQSHYGSAKQPEEIYAEEGYMTDYGHKDTPKSSSNSHYASGYTNAEDTSYLYQQWYGKDQK